MAVDETKTDVVTTVGGLRAIEVFYRGIREIDSGSTKFFQSQTRLNTPGLGTMMPDSFRDVAELSVQCISLFELEMVQVLEANKKFREREFFFDWISLYMPIRFLDQRGAESKLVSYIEESNLDTNRLCFELSPLLLTEGTSKMARVLENLRNRGFHFMLTGFGGTNCPLMKLAEFPVDYVMMSPEITVYAAKDDRSKAAVASIVNFINGLGATPIADGVMNVSQAEGLYQSECHYCAGSLAGKYMAERYIRKKTDSLRESEQ